MARYPVDRKSATRARILAAAETVIKERGSDAATVEAVMRRAGLTVGGFYAHFGSKEALAHEALVAGDGAQFRAPDRGAGRCVTRDVRQRADPALPRADRCGRPGERLSADAAAARTGPQRAFGTRRFRRAQRRTCRARGAPPPCRRRDEPARRRARGVRSARRRRVVRARRFDPARPASYRGCDGREPVPAARSLAPAGVRLAGRCVRPRRDHSRCPAPVGVGPWNNRRP